MIPPDPEFRQQNRRERIWFVKKSADWVRSVPNEVWSERQCALINALFVNRANFRLNKEQYLMMIESARRKSDRRKGSPVMPSRVMMAPKEDPCR
ncbi:MAG: hypothetical protein NTV68_09895 [Methanomicrobiales archaeon]|nr:hypothetical protein [Methanomicrobiales archaeon]